MGIYGSGGAIETLEIEPLSGHPTRLSISAADGAAGIRRAAAADDGTYATTTWLPYVTETHAAIPEPHVYADILHAVDCIEQGRASARLRRAWRPRRRDHREGLSGGAHRADAGAGEPLLMADTVRLALLGCGDVAQRDYLPEMHRLAGRAELVAVCGRSAGAGARGRRAVRDSGLVRRLRRDARRERRRRGDQPHPHPDPHARRRWRRCAPASTSTREKPVATSLADARRIRDEASRRGLTLVCAPSVLLFPQVRFARELVESGTIGTVHAALGRGYGGVPPWCGYPSDPSPFFARGGGPLADMGVYPLHAITGILGPAQTGQRVRRQAQDGFIVEDGPFAGKRVPIEVEDNWHLMLDLAMARLASVTANNVAHAQPRAADGAVRLGRHRRGRSARRLGAGRDLLPGEGWTLSAVPHERAAGPDHLLGVEHLVECLTSGARPIPSIDHAIHVVEIMEAADQSAATGRAVDLETTFRSATVTRPFGSSRATPSWIHQPPTGWGSGLQALRVEHHVGCASRPLPPQTTLAVRGNAQHPVPASRRGTRPSARRAAWPGRPWTRCPGRAPG